MPNNQKILPLRYVGYIKFSLFEHQTNGLIFLLIQRQVGDRKFVNFLSILVFFVLHFCFSSKFSFLSSPTVNFLHYSFRFQLFIVNSCSNALHIHCDDGLQIHLDMSFPVIKSIRFLTFWVRSCPLLNETIHFDSHVSEATVPSLVTVWKLFCKTAFLLFFF